MGKELTEEEYKKLTDNITGIIAYADKNPCLASVKIASMLVDKGIIEVKKENKDDMETSS